MLTGTGVDSLEVSATGVKAKIKGKDGKIVEDTFSHVIVAVGIIANTENIGLESVGVTIERGHHRDRSIWPHQLPGRVGDWRCHAGRRGWRTRRAMKV